MNWIGRLLLGVRPDQRITTVDQTPRFVGCPRCGGLESAKVCDLFGWRLAYTGDHENQHAPMRCELVVIGARLSCQRCGSVYSVGPLGAFDHHVRALPYSPQIPERPAPGDANALGRGEHRDRLPLPSTQPSGPPRPLRPPPPEPLERPAP